MEFKDFKDYYAALGVARDAPHDVIKRAYRKLARKYHPDVSKEPNAEARFKEVAEAHEALIDPERRAAYDDLAAEHALESQARAAGRAYRPPGGAERGYEYSGRGAPDGFGTGGGRDIDGEQFSAFFESLFGRGGGTGDFGRAAGMNGSRAHRAAPAASPDHHARIEIDLEDAYRGARHTIALRHPVVGADGRTQLRERQVEVQIPRGIRPGQHLRLSGMGSGAPGPNGQGGGPAGDLYLEIAFRPHERFRIDGADVWCDLPLSPWEAALGGPVNARTPEGEVSLNVPAGSRSGRKLRLKGRGLPVQTAGAGKQPGDLYAVLRIVCPPAHSEAERAAYSALAQAFAGFAPRDEAPQVPPAPSPSPGTAPSNASTPEDHSP